MPLNDVFLKPVALKVRMDRQPNKTCLSAQFGMNVPEVLRGLMDTDFYKLDYRNVTSKLLSEVVSYEDVVQALQKIIDSNIFVFDEKSDGM